MTATVLRRKTELEGKRLARLLIGADSEKGGPLEGAPGGPLGGMLPRKIL